MLRHGERPITIGCCHVYDHQKYEAIEAFQHDGKNFVVWLSKCATCGAPFQSITIRPTFGNIASLTFTRRCKLHASRGRKVTPEEVSGRHTCRTTTLPRRVPWYREEPITIRSSLPDVRQQLDEWRIPQMMKSCGMRRGMSPDEFADTYERFLQHNYQTRNRAGELIFGDKDRAKMWAWFWLRDNGYPSLEYRLKTDPEWHDASQTRTGTRLMVFRNPALAAESADAG